MREASRVYAMTREQARTLTARYPEHAGKVRVLEPSVPDPCGGDDAVYEACAERLLAALRNAGIVPGDCGTDELAGGAP